MLEKLAKNHLLFEETLTHIVNSPWNDNIYILLCLREKQMYSEITRGLDTE